MKRDYMKVLKELHDSEINFSISTEYNYEPNCKDEGFIFKLGDYANGFILEFITDDIYEGFDRLLLEVKERYPSSDFITGIKEGE